MKNYFTTKELVPEHIFKARGESARELMDNRIIEMMNKLREWCGVPMTVNGKGRNWSGYRTKECPEWTAYSQHNFGRAIDSVCSIEPKKFHKEILQNLVNYPYIRFIEIDITWLHIDCRDNLGGDRVLLWSPKRGFVPIDKYLKEIL